ncbi:hypothetical protein DSM106972_069930 [Dulcicalothrix desertica PCC 7102]|uniref:DUF2269 domain-containing protein n=1 Tax=Dulcicalothrix desertica PCC 7102 TaxID=232991 RepID=A0A433V4G7_9CYAN|nr:hypothetical protein [Dulcicalothrix desertica]RUT00987.1 hypothetical protein DSM106972_069930 [Dulcicalothrix desertica PCC 7102]TWH39238.1 hypothetical protein CAL7102_08454 [Dulcicalothrix desertica PCC 7102]
MKKLSVKPKNWLLSFHVASGGIWFGAALCMVVVALFKGGKAGNGDELYAINYILKVLDDFVVIPSANLSLLTGGLLSWLTIWGFFKHYWVIFKWVATVTLIVSGTIWLGPWVNAMTSISEAERLQALHNPLYLFDQRGALIGGAIQTSLILVIIAVSVIKPWGRRILKTKPSEEPSASTS